MSIAKNAFVFTMMFLFFTNIILKTFMLDEAFFSYLGRKIPKYVSGRSYSLLFALTLPFERALLTFKYTFTSCSVTHTDFLVRCIKIAFVNCFLAADPLRFIQ